MGPAIARYAAAQMLGCALALLLVGCAVGALVVWLL